MIGPGASGAEPEPPKPHDIVELSHPTDAGGADQGPIPAEVPPRPLAPLEPAGKRIYHGVCINAENAADFPRRIATYAALVGHRPAVLVQYAHAYDREKALDWDYYAPVLRTMIRSRGDGVLSSPAANTSTVPPRALGATPCLTAFSTSGCSTSDGIAAPRSHVGTSMRTERRSSKRSRSASRPAPTPPHRPATAR